MVKVNSILSARFKKRKKSLKMASLAKNSSEGALSGFSGIFGPAKLDETAKASLRHILEKYSDSDRQEIDGDLQALVSVTSEVRAISNQAAILHGERIKKAQAILKKYQEGAFTAWLINTYGNRQTPYNFLQYYDFHQEIPQNLRIQLEAMPRQAVYTLASRDGDADRKKRIVENYRGETKDELLSLIRETFPLPSTDRRRSDVTEGIVSMLRKTHALLSKQAGGLTHEQKSVVRRWIQELNQAIEG